MITDLQQLLLSCFKYNRFLPSSLFFTHRVLLISGPKVGLVDQVIATLLVITPFVNRWYEPTTWEINIRKAHKYTFVARSVLLLHCSLPWPVQCTRAWGSLCTMKEVWVVPRSKIGLTQTHRHHMTWHLCDSLLHCVTFHLKTLWSQLRNATSTNADSRTVQRLLYRPY